MEHNELINDFVRFQKMNFGYQLKEEELRNHFYDETLVERGNMIQGLKIVEQNNDYIMLSFKSNFSKFKIGTYLTLISEKTHEKHNVIVKEININSITLEKGYNTYFPISDSQDLYKLEDSVFKDPSYVLHTISELARYDYSCRFLDILFDKKAVIKSAEELSSLEVNEYLTKYNEPPNKKQHEIINCCAKMPEMYAVQGPPGTGKTHVLAIIADMFYENKKNVFIITNNHVALENALNKVYEINKSANIVKQHSSTRRVNLNKNIEIVDSSEVSYRMNKSVVAGMTIFSLINNYRFPNTAITPDVLIVDEASQMPLHLALCIGAIKAKSVLLFGDEKQMAPIYNDDLKDSIYAKSIFDWFISFRPDHLDTLQNTYRMNKELTDTVAKGLYQKDGINYLESNDSIANRKLSINDNWKGLRYNKIINPEQPFVWCRTPLNFAKQINHDEANIIATLVLDFLTLGLKTEDICVVTPFKRQAGLIKTLLLEQNLELNKLPIIDTVERIQGQSVEVVIISYVASDPDYLVSISNFIFSRNRLNVAISRAKTKVIFLCADAILDITPNTLSSFNNQEFLRRKKENAFIVDLTNKTY